MSGAGPRLVANTAGVVSTNTLHTVRLLEPVESTQVAAASLNSLTLLSAEIEGHALGGGMLKLEPSEASQLALPLPRDPLGLGELSNLDAYVREGHHKEAVALGDRLFLGQFLGLHQDEIEVLKTAVRDLRSWRLGR